MKKKNAKKLLLELKNENPDTFYPTNLLKKLGYQRYQCSQSNIMFWSKVERSKCAEYDSHAFLDSQEFTPLTFTDVWHNFSNHMQKRSYTPIAPYPVVARWREDLDFTIASIVDFQPYVVSGEVPPPANPLIIPQPCLRFVDIANVGITGRHFTSFTMIGQHAFNSPVEYEQEKYFLDLYEWLSKTIGIPSEKIIIHEDAWSGGGSCGPSLEFFIDGLEVANQVYMMYRIEETEADLNLIPLDIKVLDMGSGQERYAWLTQGTSNAYIACMPSVFEYLYSFLPSILDNNIAKQIYAITAQYDFSEETSVDELPTILSNHNISEKHQEEFFALVDTCIIADHSRTLLFALHDGALPSNVKGGYNLRILLRRMIQIIQKRKWDINIRQLLELHAQEVHSQYPDLIQSIDHTTTIIQLEKEKYATHLQKCSHKLKKLLKTEHITPEQFVTLYVSDGLSPYDIQSYMKENGKSFPLPSNFTELLDNFYKKSSKKNETSNIFASYINDLPPTEKLFYHDSSTTIHTPKLLKKFVIDTKTYLVFDKTIFFPEMGGQIFDTGLIDNYRVIKVFQINNIIIHQVEEDS